MSTPRQYARSSGRIHVVNNPSKWLRLTLCCLMVLLWATQVPASTEGPGHRSGNSEIELKELYGLRGNKLPQSVTTYERASSPVKRRPRWKSPKDRFLRESLFPGAGSGTLSGKITAIGFPLVCYIAWKEDWPSAIINPVLYLQFYNLTEKFNFEHGGAYLVDYPLAWLEMSFHVYFRLYLGAGVVNWLFDRDAFTEHGLDRKGKWWRLIKGSSAAYIAIIGSFFLDCWVRPMTLAFGYIAWTHWFQPEKAHFSENILTGMCLYYLVKAYTEMDDDSPGGTASLDGQKDESGVRVSPYMASLDGGMAPGLCLTGKF